LPWARFAPSLARRLQSFATLRFNMIGTRCSRVRHRLPRIASR
jgi:hypothetical protein